MSLIALLASVSLVGAPTFHIDLTRYFPDAASEQSQRVTLLAEVDQFAKTPLTALRSPEVLFLWLKTHDQLQSDLQRHGIYLYLKAEEDDADHADETASQALDPPYASLEAATDAALAGLDSAFLSSAMTKDPALARYRYFIDGARHDAAKANTATAARTLVSAPTLQSLADAYRTLAPKPSTLKPTGDAESQAKQKFDAKWAPYLRGEENFAALLIPITHLHEGMALLQGFTGAPDRAYQAAGLTSQEVEGVLQAVSRSNAGRHYKSVLADIVARQLGRPTSALHVWNLDSVDTYRPAPIDFGDAVPLVLSATQGMGGEYTTAFAQLFAPARGRVEWCREPHCDDTGFSVGFSGVESGLFFGAYRGDTNSVRALAHEAGHAVHRQFMNQNQPIAPYNLGPHFVFESFAIFNELLLLEHLYRTAEAPAAKAYYLHQWLDDVVFQIYGSAEETDLEQSIYAGVAKGDMRNAKDLDALTKTVLARYEPAVALAPEMNLAWARNRLYFTDPLYDVNYLFAGLLAVQYVTQFEAQPQDFSHRYVALLKNGFDDTPQALERRFLGIDLDNSTLLVDSAAALIEKRTIELQTLYKAAAPKPNVAH